MKKRLITSISLNVILILYIIFINKKETKIETKSNITHEIKTQNSNTEYTEKTYRKNGSLLTSKSIKNITKDTIDTTTKTKEKIETKNENSLYIGFLKNINDYDIRNTDLLLEYKLTSNFSVTASTNLKYETKVGILFALY